MSSRGQILPLFHFHLIKFHFVCRVWLARVPDGLLQHPNVAGELSRRVVGQQDLLPHHSAHVGVVERLRSSLRVALPVLQVAHGHLRLRHPRRIVRLWHCEHQVGSGTKSFLCNLTALIDLDWVQLMWIDWVRLIGWNWWAFIGCSRLGEVDMRWFDAVDWEELTTDKRWLDASDEHWLDVVDWVNLISAGWLRLQLMSVDWVPLINVDWIHFNAWSWWTLIECSWLG